MREVEYISSKQSGGKFGKKSIDPAVEAHFRVCFFAVLVSSDDLHIYMTFLRNSVHIFLLFLQNLMPTFI